MLLLRYTSQYFLVLLQSWSAINHNLILEHFVTPQKNTSEWPFPSLENLPNSGIKPWSPALQAVLYHLSHQGSPKETL